MLNQLNIASLKAGLCMNNSIDHRIKVGDGGIEYVHDEYVYLGQYASRAGKILKSQDALKTLGRAIGL